MTKSIKITTEHSTRHTQDTQVIHLKLSGGSPWFAYLWIDDNLYTVTKARTVQIKRTK